MFAVDLAFLALVLALALWRLLAPAWRPRLRMGGAGVGLVLAALQWALWGVTWQSLPAVPLLALSALPPLRTGSVLRWTGRLGLAGIGHGPVHGHHQRTRRHSRHDGSCRGRRQLNLTDLEKQS